jgi:hypothetical protein
MLRYNRCSKPKLENNKNIGRIQHDKRRTAFFDGTF